MSARRGPLWVPAKRFGLLQAGGAKLRLIDDVSILGTNSALTTTEKLEMGGIDSYLALAKAWHRAAHPRGHVVVHLRSGETPTGELHPDSRAEAARGVMGGGC